MSGRLQGKRALVIGATNEGGIGQAIAARFVREGGRVVIGGRNLEKTRSIAGPIGAEAIACDITSEESIGNAVGEAAALLGGLDVAVNAAGVNRSVALADETAEGLLEQAKVHFVGTALFIRDAAAAMTGGGSIMTVSTLTAELTTFRLGAYAASKAAADKIVEVAAVEYGERGIRVNSIAPGLTSTGMTSAYFQNDKILEAFRRETPTGHIASPEDVAAAALWLASDECVATGDLIRVSGGMHLRRLPTARDFGA